MSHQIKFRIWSTQVKRFINSQEIVESFSNIFIPTSSPESQNMNCAIASTENCIIQQFTGLLDKNRKEVFIGDIVKFYPWNSPSSHRGTEDYLSKSLKQIVYGLDFGQFPTAGFCAINLQPSDLEDGHQLNCMDTYNMEIVGNIFENPELLKL